MSLLMYDIDSKYQLIITKTFDAYCSFFNIQDLVNVEISVVESNEIKNINNQTRGVDKVTDVLSFPCIDNVELDKLDSYPDYCYDIDSEELMLGSIIICMDKVIEQAKEYGNTIERELSYLTVHGLLHLLGYDHMNEFEKKDMREKEELILARL